MNIHLELLGFESMINFEVLVVMKFAFEHSAFFVVKRFRSVTSGKVSEKYGASKICLIEANIQAKFPQKPHKTAPAVCAFQAHPIFVPYIQ